MRFSIAQQAGGQFFFELRDGDQLLLVSPPFTDRDQAIAAVRTTIDAIEEADGYEAEATGAGYVLRVYDGDDNLLAESPATADAAGTDPVATALLDGAARTDDYEVTVTTTSTDTVATPLAFRSMRDVDPSGYYDFDAVGTSREGGGQSFTEGDSHYFLINDDAGEPLLFTRFYGTAGQRNKRMRSVLEAAGRDTRYETVEDGGAYYFIVKARNGMEIARSRRFASAAAMTSAMGYLQGYAPDAYRAVRSTRRRGSGDSNDYDLTLAGTTNEPGFDAYRAGPGQFVFLFNDEGGKPMLFSQGYAGRSSRDNGIRAIIKNAGYEERYELKEENGEHFFVLRAGNRREIARSRAYPTAAAAMAAMAFLRSRAPGYADQYGVVLRDRTTTETESFTIHVDPRDGGGAGVLGAAALGAAAGALASDDDDEEDAGVGAAGAAGGAIGVAAASGAAATPAPEPAREPATPVAAGAGRGAAGGAAAGGAATGGVAAGGAAAGGAAAGGAATGRGAYAASSATSSGCMKWLLPLLLALLLLALLLWLLRGCEGCASTTADDSSGVVEGDASMTEEDAIPLPPVPTDSMEVDTTSMAVPPAVAMDSIDVVSEPDPEPEPETAPAPEAEPEPETLPEPEPAAAVPSAPDVSGAIVPRSAASGFDLGGFALRPGSMEARLLAYLNDTGAPAGRSFVFGRVLYPSDDHPIDEAGAEQVFLVGEILKRFPNVRATIHGHIDGTESETYTGPNPRGSMTLSQLRAHCVWQRLVYQGIPRSQIQMVGHANDDPVGSDETAEGRQANRRAEIEITRK